MKFQGQDHPTGALGIEQFRGGFANVTPENVLVVMIVVEVPKSEIQAMHRTQADVCESPLWKEADITLE